VLGLIRHSTRSKAPRSARVARVLPWLRRLLRSADFVPVRRKTPCGPSPGRDFRPRPDGHFVHREAEALARAKERIWAACIHMDRRPAGRALRMAPSASRGMVWLNSENNRHLPTPLGGNQGSESAGDGATTAFDFYMEETKKKPHCLAHGNHRVPKMGA